MNPTIIGFPKGKIQLLKILLIGVIEALDWNKVEKVLPKYRIHYATAQEIQRLLDQIKEFEQWLAKYYPELYRYLRELSVILFLAYLLAYLRLLWGLVELVYALYYPLLKLLLRLLKLSIKVSTLPITLPFNGVMLLVKKLQQLIQKRSTAKNRIIKFYYTIQCKLLQWNIERKLKGLGNMIRADYLTSSEELYKRLLL